MITITPHFAAITAFMICSGIIIGFVWMHNAYKPQKMISQLILKSIQGFFFAFITYLSVLLIDSFVKVIIFGIIGYANISYHLGALILCLIFGIIVIIGAGLNAPTIKTIVNMAITIGISIYFIWFSFDVLFPNYEKVFYYPVIYIVGILFIVNLIWIIFDFIQNRNPVVLKKLWDFSEKYKRLFSIKGFIIFWLLFGIEIILKFEGLGLLHWI
jgi:hypothetical protein